MSNEYTPTTEQVRRYWQYGANAWTDERARDDDTQQDGSFIGAEFDRWLAAHDAEIRAEQIETDAAIADKEASGWYSDAGRYGIAASENIATFIRAQLAPRPPAPELIPGTQAALDALSIYRKG